MPAKCIWDYSLEPSWCAVADCQKEGRFKCKLHPDAGAVCASHKREHIQEWRRKVAELDSRPIARRSPRKAAPEAVAVRPSVEIRH